MRPIKTEISIDLEAEIKFDEIANIYVAYSPMFEIFSQGKSIDDAKLALEDAIHSFLFVADKHNLLGRCLKT